MARLSGKVMALLGVVATFVVVTFPIWLAQVWTLVSDRPFAEDMQGRGWGWIVITPYYGWFCVAIGLALVGIAAFVAVGDRAVHWTPLLPVTPTPPPPEPPLITLRAVGGGEVHIEVQNTGTRGDFIVRGRIVSTGKYEHAYQAAFHIAGLTLRKGETKVVTLAQRASSSYEVWIPTAGSHVSEWRLDQYKGDLCIRVLVAVEHDQKAELPTLAKVIYEISAPVRRGAFQIKAVEEV